MWFVPEESSWGTEEINYDMPTEGENATSNGI